jgi:hypothetical protein
MSAILNFDIKSLDKNCMYLIGNNNNNNKATHRWKRCGKYAIFNN